MRGLLGPLGCPGSRRVWTSLLRRDSLLESRLFPIQDLQGGETVGKASKVPSRESFVLPPRMARPSLEDGCFVCSKWAPLGEEKALACHWGAGGPLYSQNLMAGLK